MCVAGVAEGRLSHEEAVALIVDAAVPAWHMTNETPLCGSPLYAAAVEDCAHGTPVQNCAKFLALLIVAGVESGAMALQGVVTNLIEQVPTPSLHTRYHRSSLAF